MHVRSALRAAPKEEVGWPAKDDGRAEESAQEGLQVGEEGHGGCHEEGEGELAAGDEEPVRGGLSTVVIVDSRGEQRSMVCPM